MIQLEIVGFRVGAPLGAACSAYLVGDGSTLLLFECGPGALERLWQRGPAERLDAIVISHMHADHVLDLLPFSGEVTQMSMRERRVPELYVPRDRGPQALDALARAVGSDAARFDLAFAMREYDDTRPVRLGGLQLTFARTAPPSPVTPCA